MSDVAKSKELQAIGAIEAFRVEGFGRLEFCDVGHLHEALPRIGSMQHLANRIEGRLRRQRVQLDRNLDDHALRKTAHRRRE